MAPILHVRDVLHLPAFNITIPRLDLHLNVPRLDLHVNLTEILDSATRQGPAEEEDVADRWHLLVLYSAALAIILATGVLCWTRSEGLNWSCFQPRRSKWATLGHKSAFFRFVTRKSHRNFQRLLDQEPESKARRMTQLSDELSRSRGRNESTVARPKCDMVLLVYKPRNKDKRRTELDKENAKWAEEKLALIRERLFVETVAETNDLDTGGFVENILRCLRIHEKEPFDVHYLLTRPPPAEPAPTPGMRPEVKERRIKRLLRRLATSDRMMKRRKLPQTATGYQQLRQLQPFDEELQPLDPLVHEGLEAYLDEFSPFECADTVEWVHGRPELFTSMERIHLLRLVLETPVAEGGCGANLAEAEERGAFTVVAIHDGNRTKTRSLADDPNQVHDDPNQVHAAAKADSEASMSLRTQSSMCSSVGSEASMGALPPDTAKNRKSVRISTSLEESDQASAPTTGIAVEGRSSLRHPVDDMLTRVRAETETRMRAASKAINESIKTTWRILLRHWVNANVVEGTLVTNWYRQPLHLLPQAPLDEIRDYYGAEVALYVAFLQHLTRWMLALGIIGLFPFAGWVYYGTMDNWACSVYSIVALVWSFAFNKGWRRVNSELAFQWNTDDKGQGQQQRYQFDKEQSVEKEQGLYTDNGFFANLSAFPCYIPPSGPAAQDTSYRYEFPRSEDYHGHSDVKEHSTFDRTRRWYRQLMSWVTIVILVLVFAWVVVLLLNLRSSVMMWAFVLPEDSMHPLLFKYRVSLASLVGTLPNTIWTSIVSIVGKKLVATKLNDWENYRLQSQYDQALLIKKFAILTINTYSPLFYIAFFKATSVWHDYCHDLNDFTATEEEIIAAHHGLNPFCMEELLSFLLSTLLLRPATKFLAIGFRWVTYWRCSSSSKAPCYERQVKLDVWEGVMDECLDLVLQIGYVVLFAPALPVAAFIVYLTDMVLLRTEAYKLLKLRRRPLPKNTREIAGLNKLLGTLGFVGVATNVALVFFTATQIKRLVTSEGRTIPWVGIHISQDNLSFFFVAVEHIVILINFGVASLLDADPKVAVRKMFSERVEEVLWKEEMMQKRHKWKSQTAKDSLASRVMTPAKLQPFKLGPFKMVKVDHTSLKFELSGAGWAIDQHASLLQKRMDAPAFGLKWKAVGAIRPASGNELTNTKLSKALKRKKEFTKDEFDTFGVDNLSASHFILAGNMYFQPAAPERVMVRGRLSELSQVTLERASLETAGIDTKAFEFAFAYPLSRFAGVEEGPKLLRDLELDLHDMAEAETWEAEETERENALRFLAFGGFVYLNQHSEVIQVTALLQAEVGLKFKQDPVCGFSDDFWEGTSIARQQDATMLNGICELLDRRSALQVPTFPFLRSLGVTGFCWIKPGEVFFPSETKSQHQNIRHSLKLVRKKEHYKKYTDIAREKWRAGGFVYRYADGEACHLYAVDDSEMNQRMTWAVRLIQKTWRWRVLKVKQSKAQR